MFDKAADFFSVARKCFSARNRYLTLPVSSLRQGDFVRLGLDDTRTSLRSIDIDDLFLAILCMLIYFYFSTLEYKYAPGTGIFFKELFTLLYFFQRKVFLKRAISCLDNASRIDLLLKEY